MKLRVVSWLLFACLSSLLFTFGCTADDSTDEPGPATGDGGPGTDASLTQKDGGPNGTDGGDGGPVVDGSPGPDGGHEGGTGASYTVGGLLTGLASGGTVVLQDNGGDTLTLTANGAFTFATPVASGSTYAVSVLSQPTSPAQSCNVTGGAGTVTSGSVGTVEVVCTTAAFTLGGSVSGLTGTGLALNDGVGDDLVITGNGTFMFTHPLPSGTSFTVTVKTPPTNPAQTCRVGGGVGTIGSANVSSVSVNCNPNTFFVNVTVNGLTGTGLVLQDNGGDNLAVSTKSASFATPVASGQPYAVTVFTQPTNPSQTCTPAAPANGTVAAADVSVTVNCTTASYTISGTLAGLGTGDSVVLQDNGGDNLTVSANGAFTFATPVASGATYTVTALAPTGPIAQTCTSPNGSSKVGGANVTGITVTCTSTPQTIGGTITGLPANQSVVLEDVYGNPAATDDLTVSTNGTFTFKTSVASGAAYAINLKTPYTGGTCHLFERTGTVGTGPVTTVTATCGVDYYVTASTGSDAANGLTTATAWQTITHAIATMPTTGAILNVSPGTYDATNGESFPIEPRSNQTLLGDLANKGIGTIISGTGPYQPGGEVGMQYSFVPIMAIPPGVTGVALRGLDVVGPVMDTVEGIVVDGSTVTVANVTVSGASVEAIADLNGGNLTLIDSTIEDAVTLITDSTTVFKARRNDFVGGGDATAVKVGFTSAVLTGSNVDLGTASDPGGNSIVAASTGYGLHIATATIGVLAAGNTWRPNVQGATAAGTYPAQVVTGTATMPPEGDNYWLVTGSSVQF